MSKNNIRELLDEEVKGINCIQYIMKCFRSERYKIENEELVINEQIKAVNKVKYTFIKLI